jgi:hypothetical protein
MEHHPFFDLWLHDTLEFTEYLGVEIVERVTLHEWPLSCVQHLRLADGRQLVYKSQLSAASLEPEFFTAASRDQAGSPNPAQVRLPHAEVLGQLQNSIGMLFEYIDAPRLEELHLTEEGIVKHGKHLLSNLRLFHVEMPAYIDISSPDIWQAFVKETLSLLQGLITNGQFSLTPPAALDKLTQWSMSHALSTAIAEPAVLNHGDLCGDNIFTTPQGFIIIDWQRPVRGPAGLDLVQYYSTMGVEPLKYLPREIVDLDKFIHLRWFAECKRYWFPPGESYDRQVADLISQILPRE